MLIDNMVGHTYVKIFHFDQGLVVILLNLSHFCVKVDPRILYSRCGIWINQKYIINYLPTP